MDNMIDHALNLVIGVAILAALLVGAALVTRWREVRKRNRR